MRNSKTIEPNIHPKKADKWIDRDIIKTTKIRIFDFS